MIYPRSSSTLLLALCAALAAGWLPASALAQSDEPLGGRLGVGWWADPVIDNGDNGATNGFTEIWVNDDWGVRSARYESSLDEFGVDNSSHASIDLKRRFFSLSEDHFVSLGAGWESIGLSGGESSSGLRLSAGGQFNVGGTVSLYGHTSWLPELDDVSGRSNLEAQEFEAGLAFDPDPSMSVRLGFRRFRLDFDEGGSSATSESDGFILGADFHW